MAVVTLTIAGRSYAVSCRDGEEPHLRALAERVDQKAGQAKSAVGDTSEPRLLLLSALLLADALNDAEAAGTASTATSLVPKLTNIAEALERIAQRVES